MLILDLNLYTLAFSVIGERIPDEITISRFENLHALIRKDLYKKRLIFTSTLNTKDVIEAVSISCDKIGNQNTIIRTFTDMQ